MTEKEQLDLLVGSNIKRARLDAGYTQEKFSELIGLGTKSLSAAERGTVGVSLNTLVRICRVLSVSSDTLLFEAVPKNDVHSITERLERLSPEQLSIVGDVICKLLEAFALQSRE